MDWRKDVQRSARLGQRTLYNGTIEAADWAAVRRELGHFWTTLCAAAREAYDGHPLDWDAIDCSIWPDGGRIIGFPGRQSREGRDERVSVDVTITIAEEEYHRLPDADEDEAAFERGYEEVLARMSNALRAAASAEPAASAIRDLKSWHPFEIFYYDADETADAEPLLT